MSQLKLEYIDQIAVIRGGAALNAALIADLADLCAAVAEDARAVVLDPDRDVWCGYEGAVGSGDLFAAFAELPQPTIAALSGPTVNGGLELALAADIRVAAEACTIGFDPLSVEFPRAGGLQRLTRAVGRSRATQLTMLERSIDAATALDWGLVNEVAEDVSEAAMALARTIAARGPLAARYAKDAIQHGLEMPLAQALHYETELTILLQDTADRAEGVDAFVSKRTPQFSGT